MKITIGIKRSFVVSDAFGPKYEYHTLIIASHKLAAYFIAIRVEYMFFKVLEIEELNAQKLKKLYSLEA